MLASRALSTALTGGEPGGTLVVPVACHPSSDPSDADLSTRPRGHRSPEPSGQSRRSIISPRAVDSIFRPPKHPWVAAVAVLVVLLLVAELWVRWVKPQLPVVRSGDAAEMILKARRIDELAATDPRLDVVFLGTSMMDSAISPREFLGASTKYRSAYNASIVGAPATTQVRWVEEIVLHDLRPRLIVVGVHPIDLLLTDPLNLNIQPGQSDVVFSRVERELRPGVLGTVDRYLNDNVELIAQRGSLRQPGVMMEATWNQYRHIDPKPFIPLRDEQDWKRALEPDGTSKLFHDQSYKPTKAVSDLRSNLQRKDFSANDVYRLLGALEQRARQFGAEVVVVIPPVPLEEWRAGGVDLASLRDGQELITQAGRSFGMDVIDFTDKRYPTSMFADILHSNAKGSVQFSHDLVVELETR